MKYTVLFCLITATVIASGTPEQVAELKPARDLNGVFQFRSQAAQEELAYALIDILLPETKDEVKTPEEVFEILTSKGLVPSTPWRTGQIVTVGDLSMLSARLLDAPEEVDRDDPMQCLNYLKNLGVQFKSLGGALREIESLYQARIKALKNENIEQGGPGYPPQGVGSPDP